MKEYVIVEEIPTLEAQVLIIKNHKNRQLLAVKQLLAFEDERFGNEQLTALGRAARLRREYEKGRAISPNLYLGIAQVEEVDEKTLLLGPIEQEPNLSDPGKGYGLIMRAIPQKNLLIHRIRRLRSAEQKMRFLSRLARDIDEIQKRYPLAEGSDEKGRTWGSLLQVAARGEHNLKLLIRAMQAQPKIFRGYEALEEDFRQLINHRLPLLQGRLEERRREGYVRASHGDLSLRNLGVFQRRIYAFDPVVFKEDYAMIDVLSDFAILAAHIAAAMGINWSEFLIGEYLKITAQPYYGLLSYYLAEKAVVLVAVRNIEGQIEEGKRFLPVASHYVDEAKASLFQLASE